MGSPLEIPRNIQKYKSWPRRNAEWTIGTWITPIQFRIVNWVKSLSLSSLAAVAEPCLAEIFCFMSSTTPHITVAMPRTFCTTSTFFLQPRIFLFFSGNSRLPPNGSFQRKPLCGWAQFGVRRYRSGKNRYRHLRIQRQPVPVRVVAQRFGDTAYCDRC